MKFFSLRAGGEDKGHIFHYLHFLTCTFHIKLASGKVEVKRWSFTEWTAVTCSAFVCSWINHIFLLYNAVEAASLGFEGIYHWSFLIHPRRLLNCSFLNFSFHCWEKTRQAFLEVWENCDKMLLSTPLLKWMNRFWGYGRGKWGRKGTFYWFFGCQNDEFCILTWISKKTHTIKWT